VQRDSTLNDEKGAFKFLQALKSTREDHRRQVDALLKSEARILLLEKSRGSLVDTDVCKSFISQCLVPTIIWMRKLADAARNPEERGATGESTGRWPAHYQRFGQGSGKLQREGTCIMNTTTIDRDDEETVFESSHREWAEEWEREQQRRDKLVVEKFLAGKLKSMRSSRRPCLQLS
jgi:hypothetical protein